MNNKSRSFESDRQLSGNEILKAESDGLRSSIALELKDDSPTFSNDAAQILKFHGVYTQDDRDQRSTLRKNGSELAHMCMVRVAIPGGRLTPEQYLALDELASDLAGESLRITTRQGIQFHFVAKGDLKPVVKAVNDALLTTYAGCGDVVRNVTACTAPRSDGLDLQMAEIADQISARYKPASSAYFEIWSDGARIDQVEADPIYGTTYLPRKFKIGIATTDDNCVDLLSHDLGVVLDPALVGQVGIVVGGGLGKGHADPGSLARLAEPLCTIRTEHLLQTIDTVLSIQRDYGDRSDRSRARLKYLIESHGIEWFRRKAEARSNVPLMDFDSVKFSDSPSHLGLNLSAPSRPYYGLKLPSGRIKDTSLVALRTALRGVVQDFRPLISLTAKEDLVLFGLELEQLEKLRARLDSDGVQLSESLSPLTRDSFACPALPTCGLALAESERILPTLTKEIDDELKLHALSDSEISLRMTGCPNGCARPYLAEIGIVGRSKRSYDVYLGANRKGTRLGTLYAVDVAFDILRESLAGPFKLYSETRLPGEGFGDFCHRIGVQELTKRYAPAPRRTRKAEPSKSGQS